jgi:hypothetical protein
VPLRPFADASNTATGDYADDSSTAFLGRCVFFLVCVCVCVCVFVVVVISNPCYAPTRRFSFRSLVNDDRQAIGARDCRRDCARRTRTGVHFTPALSSRERLLSWALIFLNDDDNTHTHTHTHNSTLRRFVAASDSSSNAVARTASSTSTSTTTASSSSTTTTASARRMTAMAGWLVLFV